jgi:signal transduction histidine kinase
MPSAKRELERLDVSQVIKTDALMQRAARAPDYASENRALVELARELSRTPARILDVLAQKALQLCSAGSAGISILDASQPEPTQFRWHAIAGAWTPYLGAMMPRNFSPCGIVLERNAPQLMCDLGMHYDYVNQIRPACHEVLLVPFYSNDIAVGTIWVVKHDAAGKFDAEDLRILESLAAFTSAGYEVLKSVEKLEDLSRKRTDEIASLTVADRSKDAFIATIAHELRNPIAPIHNSAVLLSRGSPEPSVVKQAARVIERQVAALSRLIDDLMDVSRIRLGNLELNVQDVDLGEVLISAVDASCLFTTPEPSRRIILEPITTPIRVLGDHMRLTQVLENLFNNAAKYTDADATISVRPYIDGTQAVIDIMDTGIGIAPDQIDNIFELFAQAGQAGTPRSQGGLGIGLHLARQLVESHQGTLTAASDGVGRGSTFTVRLPLAAAVTTVSAILAAPSLVQRSQLQSPQYQSNM